MRECQRDNNNAMVGEFTLWECPTRRAVLEQHEFVEIDATHIRDTHSSSIAKTIFGPPKFRKSTMDFKDIPGRGKAQWHSPKPETMFHVGVMTDFILWSHENDCIAKAAASWRTVCVQVGSVLIRTARPEEKYFVLSQALNMMYLWPAVQHQVGKSWFYKHAEGGIENLRPECILSLDDWSVMSTRCVSPAHVFILNNRKPVDSLPFPALVTAAEPVSLLKFAAQCAFKGLNKAHLLKLDRDEVEAVAYETNLGDISMCMIMKVLDLSREAAADILALRCIRVSADERRELIQSEAFDDIVHEKREVEAAEKALDAVEQQADECCETVLEVRKAALAAPAKANKAKVAEKVWPAGISATLPRLQACQPPGATLWYDARLKRYQVFIGGSSISRATRLWGTQEAAKQCTRWAWTMYGLLHGDGACPIKNLWDD